MEVIEYSSKHCPPCQEMKPELRKLKRAGFKVSVVDCDKEISKCRGIQSVPTIVIKKGRRSKRMVGFMTAEEIKSKLTLHYNRARQAAITNPIPLVSPRARYVLLESSRFKMRVLRLFL